MCTKIFLVKCYAILVVGLLPLMGCGGTTEDSVNGSSSDYESEQMLQTPAEPEQEEQQVYRVPFDGELPAVAPLPSPEQWPLPTSESSFPGSGSKQTAIIMDDRIWVYTLEREIGVSPDTIQPAWVSANGLSWIRIDEPVPLPKRAGYSITSDGEKAFLLGGSYIDPLQVILSDIWSTTDGLIWNNISSETNWSGIVGAGIVSRKQSIIVSGGFDPDWKNYRDYDSVWESSDGKNWNTLTEDLIVDGHILYHFLIDSGEQFFIVDLQTGILKSSNGQTWEHIPAFTEEGESQGYPPNRWDFQALWFQDRLIVLGGMHHPPIFETPIPATDVWASPDGTQWEQIAPEDTLPERRNPIVTVFQDRIFFIGGYEETPMGEEPLEWKRDVWVSEDAVTWNLLAEDPTQKGVSTR